MKKHTIVLLLVLFYGFSCVAQAQKDTLQILTPLSIQEDLRALQYVIEKHHVAPRPFNNIFVKHLLHKFLNLITQNNTYFTQKEYEKLLSFEATIVEEMHKGEVRFLPFFIPFFKKKLENTIQIIEQWSKQKDIWKEKNSLKITDKDTLYWAKEADKIQDFWHKKLQLAMLQIIAQRTEKQKNSIEKAVALHQTQAILQVKEAEIRKLKRILLHPVGFEKYILSRYLLAITLCQDPHSYYMMQDEMQKILEETSNKKASFGWQLTENKQGEIIIDQLIPGGAAWKTNLLHKGDALLSVQWLGKEKIDVTLITLAELEEILDQNELLQLQVTIRKADKSIKEVTLVKALTQQDAQDLVKGFMIEGTKKVGYISLPGFYTNYDDEKNKGCAADVARELLRLKNEGIEGLILDLRFNGGGSLMEGLELAGLFIDEGSITILNRRNEKPTILKDMHRGTIYDGKLLVLVNRASASASEMLAAVLQDYNRALIVGSNTFGKATGQRPFPVFATHTQQNKMNLHFAYLTHIKLYRVTQKTAQLVGVKPDILIPDNLPEDEYSEAYQDFALAADSIEKKVLFKPLPPLPTDKLRAKHQKRLQNPQNPLAQQIKQYVLQAQEKKQSDIPLTWEGFWLWYEKNKGKSHSNNENIPQNTLLLIKNLKASEALLNIDAYTKESNQKIVDKLSKDAYLAEAYQIMLDWLEIP